MSDVRLNPQPDWPDRCGWELGFNAQMLHDFDSPVRRFEFWCDNEDKDLLNQVNAGVSFEEIARRHQRTWEGVASRHQVLVWELECRLLG